MENYYNFLFFMDPRHLYGLDVLNYNFNFKLFLLQNIYTLRQMFNGVFTFKIVYVDYRIVLQIQILKLLKSESMFYSFVNFF